MGITSKFSGYTWILIEIHFKKFRFQLDFLEISEDWVRDEGSGKGVEGFHERCPFRIWDWGLRLGCGGWGSVGKGRMAF